jgi:hypothetical protein
VNLTIPTVWLGTLVRATTTVEYDTGDVQQGMGQADVTVHLEGEDDTLTLVIGQAPDAGTDAAAILRALADELEADAASYDYLPVQWDGFVGSDRNGWGASIEGVSVDVPEGLTEDGAIVALELACRESGVFPPLWLDRYAESSSSMPVALTAEAIRNAAAAVLDGDGFESPVCEYCGDHLARRDGTWTHDNGGWGVEPTWPVECERFEDEPVTVATPDLHPFDRADVEGILTGPDAIGGGEAS